MIQFRSFSHFKIGVITKKCAWLSFKYCYKKNHNGFKNRLRFFLRFVCEMWDSLEAGSDACSTDWTLTDATICILLFFFIFCFFVCSLLTPLVCHSRQVGRLQRRGKIQHLTLTPLWCTSVRIRELCVGYVTSGLDVEIDVMFCCVCALVQNHQLHSIRVAVFTVTQNYFSSL